MYDGLKDSNNSNNGKKGKKACTGTTVQTQVDRKIRRRQCMKMSGEPKIQTKRKSLRTMRCTKPRSGQANTNVHKKQHDVETAKGNDITGNMCRSFSKVQYEEQTSSLAEEDDLEHDGNQIIKKTKQKKEIYNAKLLVTKAPTKFMIDWGSPGTLVPEQNNQS